MCSVRVVLCWVSSVVFIVLCVVCVLCVVWCVFCSGWCLLCCVLCCVCVVFCVLSVFFMLSVLSVLFVSVLCGFVVFDIYLGGGIWLYFSKFVYCCDRFVIIF